MQNVNERVALRQQGQKYAKELVIWLQQFFPSHTVTSVEVVLVKTVQNGLKQLEDRLKKTLTALRLDSMTSQPQMSSKLEHILLYVENYVMQIFRDLLVTEPPILSPSTLQCQEPLKVLPIKPEKSKGALLRDTLQMSHEDLLECLDPQGTKLVDHLVSTSVLTESDEESLASSSTRRDKTRKLLSIVSSSSAEKIEKGFLPALDATHPQQAKSFRKKMKEVKNRPPTPTCLSCRIRDEVDLSRIASFMYKKKKINKALYEDLCNASISHRKKWDMVLESDKTQHAVIEALSTKYKDFYDQCKTLEMQKLQCQCPSLDDNVRPITTTRVLPGDDNMDGTGPTDDHLPNIDHDPKSLLRRSNSISSIANMSDVSSLKSVQDSWTYEDILACSSTGRRNSHFGKKVASENISRYLGLTAAMSSLDDESFNGSSSMNSSRRRSFLQRCSSASSVTSLSELSSHMSVQEYWTTEFTPGTVDWVSTSATENSTCGHEPSMKIPTSKAKESKTVGKGRKTKTVSDVVWV